MKNEHKRGWTDATKDEMKSLHGNYNFKFVKLPKEKVPLKNKWVYDNSQ